MGSPRGDERGRVMRSVSTNKKQQEVQGECVCVSPLQLAGRDSKALF